MKEETKAKLKELGLEGLEELAEGTIEKVFKAIEVIVTDSDNKLDDMILPALPVIKAKLLELAEKIDAEEA